MQVRVNAGTVSLDEPDDCTAFKVVVSDGWHEELSHLLSAADAGTVKNGSALIAVDWIRKVSTGRISVDWNYRFANMLVYAGTKGWLSPDGGHVQGHIETQ